MINIQDICFRIQRRAFFLHHLFDEFLIQLVKIGIRDYFFRVVKRTATKKVPVSLYPSPLAISLAPIPHPIE